MYVFGFVTGAVSGYYFDIGYIEIKRAIKEKMKNEHT